MPLGALAASAALITLIAAGAWVFVTTGDDACRTFRLDVAASPDVAPVVEAAADRFNKSEQKANGSCLEAAVSRQNSWQTAGVLAGDPRAGVVPPPDVWIADSSVWVDQVRARQRDRAIPQENESIASSPAVIAMIKPVADQIGDTTGLSWGELVKRLRSDEQPLKLGFPNPTRNTTGLATLLAIQELTQTSPEVRSQQVALSRILADGAADEMRDLLAGLPTSAERGALATSTAVLPATEQLVWQYNRSRPAVPLVAVYPEEGSFRLDYPYVVTAAEDNRTGQQAAARFLAELKKSRTRTALQNSGFRAPDGSASGAFSSASGVNIRPARYTAKPATRAVATVMRLWEALSLPTRMMVLIDVSGSMNTPVPGIGKTRLDVSVSAAQQALGLFSDATEIGLWIFSTQLVGRSQDHKELVPLGQLSEVVGDISRRAALANALTQIRVRPSGSTGLYDSILAAWRAQNARNGTDKVGSVVVFTDGKNSDPAGGVSLDQLIGTIRAETNPQLPMPIYIIAFGPDADIAAAQKIAQASRGAAYSANSPAEINKVFLDAVGRRTCRPSC